MEEEILPPDYVPSEAEEYMNPRQLIFFKKMLQQQLKEILDSSFDTLQHLQKDEHYEPDLNDRAARQTETTTELRTRDRARKLVPKIEVALEKIANKTYGYCEETGEPIGLKRLLARPVARFSIEYQEEHERREKAYRDDDQEEL